MLKISVGDRSEIMGSIRHDISFARYHLLIVRLIILYPTPELIGLQAVSGADGPVMSDYS